MRQIGDAWFLIDIRYYYVYRRPNDMIMTVVNTNSYIETLKVLIIQLRTGYYCNVSICK